MGNLGDAGGPISAELWAQLRRFDPHCEISMVRTCDKSGAGRVWIVTIRQIEIGKLYEYAQGKAATLAEAVEIAIAEGERQGWAR